MSLTCQHIFQSLYNCIYCSRTNNCIYFWNLRLNLFFVTLCQTACYDQSLNISCFTQFSHLKNIVNAFFFSITNKAACVHNYHICFILIICNFISFAGKHAKHYF